VLYIAPNTNDAVSELVHVYNPATFTNEFYFNTVLGSTGLELADTRRLLFVWTTDNGGSTAFLYKVALSDEETARHVTEVTSSEVVAKDTTSSGAFETCVSTTLFAVAAATALAVAV
jgi:hypothetical protein